jgi:hypothetical protein
MDFARVRASLGLAGGSACPTLKLARRLGKLGHEWRQVIENIGIRFQNVRVTAGVSRAGQVRVQLAVHPTNGDESGWSAQCGMPNLNSSVAT